LLEKHEAKGIELSYILNILDISRRRFFDILKTYKEDKDNFSIDYKRNSSNNRIDKNIEENILTELKIEKDLIEAEDNTISDYNYSYIKDRLEENYKSKVSVPTIIDRAKKRWVLYKQAKEQSA